MAPIILPRDILLLANLTQFVQVIAMANLQLSDKREIYFRDFESVALLQNKEKWRGNKREMRTIFGREYICKDETRRRHFYIVPRDVPTKPNLAIWKTLKERCHEVRRGCIIKDELVTISNRQTNWTTLGLPPGAQDAISKTKNHHQKLPAEISR